MSLDICIYFFKPDLTFFFFFDKTIIYYKEDCSNANVLKELQMNAQEVQKINDRTTRHPPIAIQYSKIVLKKPILISCIDCSSFSKVWRSLSPYGQHNAMRSSLSHCPIMVTSKRPSPNSQQINYLVWHNLRNPKSLKSQRPQLPSNGQYKMCSTV